MKDFDEILANMDLQAPGADLFDRHAEAIARQLRASGGKSNKSSQIRRFYDELLRWEANIRNQPEGVREQAFNQALPFIRMINARAAYAAGRDNDKAKLVDDNFTKFLRAMLDRVTDYTSLRHACTLFEAVIGFSPRNP